MLPVTVVNVPAAGVVPPITASTVPPLISAVVATREAIVPSDVMLGCAAVLSVAATFATVKSPASVSVAFEFC